ncbi:dipeptide ABC transporter ATP-binding protein [Marisediminicola sp. LYQ134]|uniref:dipeptide ABC transporter ATP-binding protein n=1 Tax=unclassified Marisediminicola TaxID=2618316 RepID=UPI003983A8BD
MDASTPESARVLTVRGLDIAFESTSGPLATVSGLDLDVRAGELVALLGESGSGKTVTARAIMGIQDDAAIVTADRLDLGDVSLLSLNAEERRRLRGDSMSMVLQDALSSLNPVLTIGDQIGEIFRVHRGASRKSARASAIELLDLVGIASPAARVDDYPHQFSGGMRQRILIAMAIALQPRLLIADEPTTALDVTVQAQILRLLHDLRQRLDMGVLLITHDIGVVTEVADRLVVMHRGRVVEHGDADQIFAFPTQPYTQQLLGSAPKPERARVLPPELDADAPVLDVTGLTRVFTTGPLLRRNAVRAVDGVDLTLKRGETVGIVGESGSGKSTLARMIVGLESADEGTVMYRGRDVTRRTRGRRPSAQAGVQMVFQDPYTSLDPRMRVKDVIAEPHAVGRVGTAASRRDRVAELLELVGLQPDMMDRFPHQFSGGQRQRIGIARSLMRDPDVLVCDEPVSALDVTIQAQVIDLLVGIQERLGLSILFISHDLSVVRNLAHRVMVMYHGSAVEVGDVEQIFERPNHAYTRELLSSIPPMTRAERGKLTGVTAA